MTTISNRNENMLQHIYRCARGRLGTASLAIPDLQTDPELTVDGVGELSIRRNTPHRLQSSIRRRQGRCPSFGGGPEAIGADIVFYPLMSAAYLSRLVV